MRRRCRHHHSFRFNSFLLHIQNNGITRVKKNVVITDAASNIYGSKILDNNSSISWFLYIYMYNFIQTLA